MSSVNQIGMAGMVSLTKSPSANSKTSDPVKIRDSAQQFEALLIGQMLHSSHESGSGWLGSGGDSSSDCATDFAEQQLATTMAQQGGMGLAKLIIAGLERESSR